MSQVWPKEVWNVAACKSCPFAVNGRPPHSPVWSTGPANPIGVMVGESPGSEEIAAGKPFVGPTGRQLDQELTLVGLDRSKLFVVNATLCAPTEGKTQRKMGQAVKCCAPAFEFQIGRFRKTKHFFAMGSWASVAVLGQKVNLSNGRGFIRETGG